MMAPGHQVVGFTFGISALTFVPYIEVTTEQPLQTILYFVFVLIGSLLPDIDTPKSKLGHKFWRGLITLFSLLLLVYLFVPHYLDQYREELKVFILLLLPVLLMIRSHRKMTHSILFILLLLVYSFLLERFFSISWLYLGGLMIGVISHLAADFVTKKGIPLAYPFLKSHVQFIVTFRTGSKIEKIVVFSLVAWNIWFLTYMIF